MSGGKLLLQQRVEKCSNRMTVLIFEINTEKLISNPQLGTDSANVSAVPPTSWYICPVGQQKRMFV